MLMRALGYLIFSSQARPRLRRPALDGVLAMEVTLARNWAKSRTRGRKLHSTGAKARVGRATKSRADLERQLKACKREIANARERLIEATKQQAATSEMLRIISDSPLQSVLETVAEHAARLCDSNNAEIYRLENNLLRLVASYGELPVHIQAREGFPLNRDRVIGRAICDRRSVHVHDLAAEDSEYPSGSSDAKRQGHRTTLGTPLLRERTPIGVILFRRWEVRPFSDNQIALLESFADQAAIAIENVRLLEVEKQRTLALAHANRVATMGQLAASIAHEVKQPVAAMVTNAQAGLSWLGAQPPNLEKARQTFGYIVSDGMRAGDVVERIRDMIKKAQPRKEILNINDAIREVIELARGETMKNGISVHTDLEEGTPPLEGDRVQLQQVMLNLVMNAVEAMNGTSEVARELLISTRKTESDVVLVAVRDSGPGLALETLDHLFDAFYTTKPGGLGLGLSICRSIIEAHGGRLSAKANVPRGAIFEFGLPAAPDIAKQPAVVSAP
jgi:signal transduction histidine kinase